MNDVVVAQAPNRFLTRETAKVAEQRVNTAVVKGMESAPAALAAVSRTATQFDLQKLKKVAPLVSGENFLKAIFNFSDQTALQGARLLESSAGALDAIGLGELARGIATILRNQPEIRKGLQNLLKSSMELAAEIANDPDKIDQAVKKFQKAAKPIFDKFGENILVLTKGLASFAGLESFHGLAVAAFDGIQKGDMSKVTKYLEKNGQALLKDAAFLALTTVGLGIAGRVITAAASKAFIRKAGAKIAKKVGGKVLKSEAAKTLTKQATNLGENLVDQIPKVDDLIENIASATIENSRKASIAKFKKAVQETVEDKVGDLLDKSDAFAELTKQIENQTKDALLNDGKSLEALKLIKGARGRTQEQLEKELVESITKQLTDDVYESAFKQAQEKFITKLGTKIDDVAPEMTAKLKKTILNEAGESFEKGAKKALSKRIRKSVTKAVKRALKEVKEDRDASSHDKEEEELVLAKHTHYPPHPDTATNINDVRYVGEKDEIVTFRRKAKSDTVDDYLKRDKKPIVQEDVVA